MKKTQAVLDKEKKSMRYVGMFPFQFDASAAKGDQAIPDVIHLIPVGQWEHDLYGPILINASDIREFAQNFNAQIRKGVFITAGHEGYEELPACGWIASVDARDDGLWGTVEWNDLGRSMLNDKQFKFFSPEFYRDYEDPQTHQIYRNVITGGALTKSPYFKELEAIVFSEKALKKFNTNDNTMDKDTILAKKIEDLSAEEIAFLKEHKDELTDEQKAAYTAVIDAPVEGDGDAETPEAKAAREATEAENIAKGLNADGSAKVDAPVKTPEQVAAEEAAAGGDASKLSEKGTMVAISASELAILRDAADKGKAAFTELRNKKLGDAVTGMLFSETNKEGKFLPKSKDSLRAFIETLTDAQYAQFSTLVGELPKQSIFTEVGEGAGAVDGTAKAEMEAKVEAKLSANPKLKYSEALKEVFAENEGLETRYDKELPSVRAKVQA